MLVVWEELHARGDERKGLCAGREYGGGRNSLEEEIMESGLKWIKIRCLLMSSC